MQSKKQKQNMDTDTAPVKGKSIAWGTHSTWEPYTVRLPGG